MKKLLKKTSLSLALVATLSSFAAADSILQGSILEVKDDTKTIVIDTVYSGPVEVKVLPSTRIELDDCGWFGTDNIFDDGDFYDLKVGRHAEVKGYISNTNEMPRASKIEVKCHKQAY